MGRFFINFLIKTKMKKLFIIGILFAFTIPITAQSVYTNMTSRWSLSKDTVTNTGTDSLKITLSSSFNNITIQPKVTKISGTMTSNSTPQLYGSLDGKNYYAITGDTLHITNTSSPIVTNWVLTQNQYRIYKIAWTGAGTMSAKLEAAIFLVK